MAYARREVFRRVASGCKILAFAVCRRRRPLAAVRSFTAVRLAPDIPAYEYVSKFESIRRACRSTTSTSTALPSNSLVAPPAAAKRFQSPRTRAQKAALTCRNSSVAPVSQRVPPPPPCSTGTDEDSHRRAPRSSKPCWMRRSAKRWKHCCETC